MNLISDRYASGRGPYFRLTFSILLISAIAVAVIGAFVLMDGNDPVGATKDTSGTCGDNLTWSIDEDGNLSIIGTGQMVTYTGGGWKLWGGNTVKTVNIGDGVTSIGDSAFAGCDQLISVFIPNSVTKIGWHAFERCSKLTSVTIPDSVAIIDDSAFSGCSGLTSIFIPGSVTSIGDTPFSGCTSLMTIGVSTSNDDYSSLEGILFDRNQTALISYPAGKTSSHYVLPDSVTSIKDCAFYKCIGLTSVTIGDSVTSIGEDAFYGCSGLASVTIGDSVTSIGEYAFMGCNILSSITIPDSANSIGAFAFSGCNNLTSIFIPSSVTSLGYSSFYGSSINPFIGCTSLVMIEVDPLNHNYSSQNGILFDKGKTEIIAFPEGKLDSTYIVPSSVRNIGIFAFKNCAKLTSIIMSDSVTSIERGAFSSCSNLVSITMSSSITSIGDSAFYECNKLTSFSIPDSVTSIGQSAFYNCKGLTSVIIPGLVTCIGYDTFNGCSGLTSVYIPDSVTVIRSSAFLSCSSLASITIPDSVTSIESNAFRGCPDLLSIDFGEGLTSIDSNAFGCVFYSEDGEKWLYTSEVSDFAGYKFEGSTTTKMIRVVHEDIPRHHVIYSVEGGSIPAPTHGDVEEGKKFSVATYSGTKAGYSFGGWSDGSTIYRAGQQVTMSSKDVVLTAIWYAIYTITFDSNMDPPTILTMQTDANGKLSSLPIPTFLGHDFEGWYTSASGGTLVTSNTIFYQDAMVYAHWEETSSVPDSGDDSQTSDGSDVSRGLSSTAIIIILGCAVVVLMILCCIVHYRHSR